MSATRHSPPKHPCNRKKMFRIYGAIGSMALFVPQAVRADLADVTKVEVEVEGVSTHVSCAITCALQACRRSIPISPDAILRAFPS